ncbi:MAG: carbon-nitrogen hydrolase family protein [Bacteroidota bacterium]
MKINVTAVQDSPYFFDKEKTLQKVEALVQQHGSKSDLILFPESFIPGYPRGFSFGTSVGNRSEEGRRLYQVYYENSIDLESNDRVRLENLAKEVGTYLVVGVTEKIPRNGSLYCSMIYISPENGLLGVHRKIKPTGQERVIWAEADGKSLVAYDTKIGKLSGLICWENYMPLARQAIYNSGVEIYLAPTADARDTWLPSLQHIALEGRCYVIGCNQYFTKSMYPEKYRKMLDHFNSDEICVGGSTIVSPLGKVLAGPLFGKSGVLQAELDLDEITRSKLDFDVNGHYARPDIFQFEVKDQPSIHIEKESPK